MNIIISMAGAGKRFTESGYKNPKPLIDILGKPMIQHAIESLGITGQFIFFIQEKERERLIPLLKKVVPDCIILELNYITQGAACTCLLAKEYINNDTPLVITNCDQILEWNASAFLKYCEDSNADGCVVTYFADTNKNSYIQLDENGNGIKLAEKEVISTHSLNGVHYWKHGKYFINSAEELINKNIRANNEFYVSLTYNMMIEKGLKVKSYSLQDSDKHYSVGTPDQLLEYLSHKNSLVEIVKMDTMTRGWFIGNFEPSVLKTSNFEVGYLQHKKGERWDFHYHKIATEYNYLIRGEMRINGKIIKPGDIFIFRPDYMTDPEFLQDCELICVKTPSVPGDKYIL